jgi:hypothetical protein
VRSPLGAAGVGQVVGGINARVIQEGKEMVALFIEAIAHGFFAEFAAGRPQRSRVLEFQCHVQRPQYLDDCRYYPAIKFYPIP